MKPPDESGDRDLVNRGVEWSLYVADVRLGIDTYIGGLPEGIETHTPSFAIRMECRAIETRLSRYSHPFGRVGRPDLGETITR